MRVLAHTKKLDEALGQEQLTRRAQRIAAAGALSRLCGSNAALDGISQRMRWSQRARAAAKVMAVAGRGRAFRITTE
jgi:hypothetical protein